MLMPVSFCSLHVDHITNVRYNNNMNERFIKKVNETMKSQYVLAQQSGVSFSTINGLINQNHSINKCSAITLTRLANAMNIELETLLDPYPVMDEIHGKYKNIEYKWHWNGTSMEIHFKYENEQISIDTGNKLHLPEYMHTFPLIAEMEIEEFMDEKEFQKETEQLYGQLFSKA